MPQKHLIPDLLGLIERELVEELAEELPEIGLVAYSGVLPPDRWLLGSSLQKCIRRGLVDDATSVALALLAVDCDYAWRRLRVIAIEDVGLGGVKEVARVLSVAGRRRARAALGDHQLFVALVHGLCAATKDRTACDLCCWIELSPTAEAFRSQFLGRPARWEDVALDDGMPVWQRVLALQLIAGYTVRVGAGYRSLTKANPAAMLRVVEALQLDPLVALATLKGTGTESLNTALPFSFLLRDAACCRPVRNQLEVRGAGRIGGFIAPTFCKHTRIGLQALRMLLRGDKELRRLLTDVGATNVVQVLGFLLFQIETGLLDRYEDYAPTVRMEAERAELAHYGISDDAAAASLRAALMERLPALDDARRMAWREYMAAMTGSKGGAR